MTKIKIDDGKKTRKISVSSAETHTSVQRSTTLSRRYVHRPVAKKIAVSDANKPAEKATKSKKVIAKPATKKVIKVASAADKSAKPVAKKESKDVAKANAEILKQSKLAAKAAAEAEKKARLAAVKAKADAERRARIAERQARIAERQAHLAARKSVKKTTSDDKILKSALRNVASMDEPEEMPKKFNKKRRARRVFFALLCSAATVSALVAFVHFNMPDLSVRVAAMQTGIEATYPTFIPRNYSLSNVSSEKDGEVVMYFNGPEGAGFSLSEEKSTWDSTALLNNYVKKNYPTDFTTMREQGITIYVRGDKACWVNGGLLYNIHATGKNLTKEQIRNIATSL